MFFILGGGQNPLVPALDAGTQKSKPYQSDVYMTDFNAIPRQAREQDSFDTPPTVMKAVLFLPPPFASTGYSYFTVQVTLSFTGFFF